MSKSPISLLIPLYLLLQNPLHAQTPETGITFLNQTWAEALTKAKQENKLIFLDAYTSWCGPCKVMSRDVFTQEPVAKFYNDSFVNIKMDMEHGEGPVLAITLGIKAYPTLLFLDPQGNSVHRAVGYHDINQFTELGHTALNPALRTGSLDLRYQKGDRSPEFLKEYAYKLFETLDPRRTAIAEEYLNTQKDWATPELRDFIYRFAENPESKIFQYMAQNKEAFQKQYGKEEANVRINTVIAERLTDDKNLPRLSLADSLIALTYDTAATRKQANYRMTYYRMKGDKQKYAQATIAYLKKYNDHPEELSEAVHTFSEQIDKKRHLKKAIQWQEKIMEHDKTSEAYKTLAQLYIKIGKKGKALKTINDGLLTAKTAGENTVELEELLRAFEKIK